MSKTLAAPRLVYRGDRFVKTRFLYLALAALYFFYQMRTSEKPAVLTAQHCCLVALDNHFYHQYCCFPHASPCCWQTNILHIWIFHGCCVGSTLHEKSEEFSFVMSSWPATLSPEFACEGLPLGLLAGMTNLLLAMWFVGLAFYGNRWLKADNGDIKK